jgi:hypothetical protein
MLIVVAFGVYAISNTINLIATAPESYEFGLDLVYSLLGFDGPFDYENPITNLDLSTTGTVYFSIKNSNDINLGSDKTQFKVDVSATDWILDGITTPAENKTLSLTSTDISSLTPLDHVSASVISSASNCSRFRVQ